jgi:hypothetical protein
MHTLPSIDDVAMCIELAGMEGICGCCLTLLLDGELVLCGWGERAGESWISDTSLFTPSGLATGKGGGNGDTETAVMEAEWAW